MKIKKTAEGWNVAVDVKDADHTLAVAQVLATAQQKIMRRYGKQAQAESADVVIASATTAKADLLVAPVNVGDTVTTVEENGV